MRNDRQVSVVLLLFIAMANVAGLGAVQLFADQDGLPAGKAAAHSVPLSDFKARLSNGVCLTILGIGENPSTGKQWWLANGDVLNTPPYARMQHPPLRAMAGCVNRELMVQVDDAVDGSSDPADVNWELTNTSNQDQSNVNDSSGREIGGIAVAFAIPDVAGGATVHANVAAGEWKTVCTLEAGGCGGFCNYPGCPQNLVFGQAFAEKQQTHMFSVFDGFPALDLRLVVIDSRGKKIPAQCVGGTGGRGTLVQEFSVDLPMKSIRQWQLQSRPFDQWIEIRNISLHRGQKTDVKIVTSDDQANP